MPVGPVPGFPPIRPVANLNHPQRQRHPMRTQAGLAFAVALVLSVGSASLADEKSHRKAAEDLLVAMGVEKQLQNGIDQMVDMQAKNSPQIAPFKDTMKAFFSKHMSYAGLKEDLISMYAESFDEKELKEIKAFYMTPTGKKLVQKSPELTNKGMQLGAKRVQDNQGELREMIQAEAAKPKQ